MEDKKPNGQPKAEDVLKHMRNQIGALAQDCALNNAMIEQKNQHIHELEKEVEKLKKENVQLRKAQSDEEETKEEKPKK